MVATKTLELLQRIRELFTVPISIRLFAELATFKAKQKAAFCTLVVLPFGFGTYNVMFLYLFVLASLSISKPFDLFVARYITNDKSKIVESLRNAGRAEEALSIKGITDTDRVLSFRSLAKKRQTVNDIDGCLSILREAKKVIDSSASIPRAKGQPFDETNRIKLLEVADTINDLSTLLQEKADYDKVEVERLFEQAISIGETVCGREFPQVTVWIMNLAIYKQQQLQKYDESMALYEEILNVRETTLGKDDPLVADWMINMAYLLLSRPDAAQIGDKLEKLVMDALEIRRKVFGNDHEMVAAALNDCALMAALTAKDGDEAGLIKARSFGTASAETYERALGKDHPKSIKARADWGS